MTTLGHLLDDARAIATRDRIDYVLHGDGGVEVADVVHDTRAVRPGSLFCCIRGARTDGHDLAPAAVEQGACAVLVERVLPVSVPQIEVASVRAAIGPLSAAFHHVPSRAMRCYGVTGTNGKTTCTHLIEAIERAAGHRVAVLGTLGARVDDEHEAGSFTTPEATEIQSLLARWQRDHVVAVAMEVSSHGLDQRRVDGTRFAVAIFTNLSHDHLDYHGTMEAYFQAKLALFDPCFTPCAVVNDDDPYGRRVADEAAARGVAVVRYGTGAGADVRAESITYEAHGTTFELVAASGERRAIRTDLIGDFNVANALAAAAATLTAGIPLDAVVAGLAGRATVPGRMELVPNALGLTVIVDYAHTPDALERVLHAGRRIGGGRLHVVFGCGGDRDRAKRPAMGRIAASLADAVVVTSDNPRSEDPGAIIAEILGGITEPAAVEVEPDRRRAIARAVATAGPGDVVVIAGKGHETGQAVGTVVHPFDDRLVAAELMAERAAGSPRDAGEAS